MTITSIGVVSPVAYATAASLAVVGVAGAVVGARRSARVATGACGCLGALLLADVVVYLVSEVENHSFSPRTSLPLALCNMAVVVAALACFTRHRVLVELTYFVGLTGTLQAVITPDLSAPFPRLVFFEYLVGHLGIVAAALLLVIGLRLPPRKGAALRTYAIVVAYTAVVGIVDAATGADYMFLRKPPSNATLLSVLGPFPWYIVTASVVALAFFWLLDLPFAHARRSAGPPDCSVNASSDGATTSASDVPKGQPSKDHV